MIGNLGRYGGVIVCINGELQGAGGAVQGAVSPHKADASMVVGNAVGGGEAQVGEVGRHNSVGQCAHGVLAQGDVVPGAAGALGVQQGAGAGAGERRGARVVDGRQAGDLDSEIRGVLVILIAVGGGENPDGPGLQGGEREAARDPGPVIVAGDGKNQRLAAGKAGSASARTGGAVRRAVISADEEGLGAIGAIAQIIGDAARIIARAAIVDNGAVASALLVQGVGPGAGALGRHGESQVAVPALYGGGIAGGHRHEDVVEVVVDPIANGGGSLLSIAGAEGAAGGRVRGNINALGVDAAFHQAGLPAGGGQGQGGWRVGDDPGCAEGDGEGAGVETGDIRAVNLVGEEEDGIAAIGQVVH